MFGSESIWPAFYYFSADSLLHLERPTGLNTHTHTHTQMEGFDNNDDGAFDNHDGNHDNISNNMSSKTELGVNEYHAVTLCSLEMH